MPQLDAIVNTESRRGRTSHDISAIRAPFAYTGIAAFNGAHLAEVLFEIVNINLASKVTKAGNKNEAAGGREDDCVARAKRERMRSNSTIVENGGLGRHVPVHDTKLARIGRPCNIMDRAFLVQGHASIERAIRAEEIQRRLAIVALSGAIDIGLCEDENAGAALIPLELNLVALEKGLL